MKKISSFLILILIINLCLAFVPYQAVALSFNPNYIISDLEMTEYNSMGLNDIQKFLERKEGTLGTYITEDVDGKRKRASEIIYNAAQTNKINPKVILVLLQKEQSLVENPNPTQYNYDWATGYHRPDGSDPNDPALQKYKGFAIQIDGGAGSLRWYIDNYPTPWLYKIGQTYDIDGYSITPQNLATVCLYNYTPHYLGNYKFWQIWNRWFAKNYPDGSLLQVEGEPGIWLIKYGKRHPFLSRTAFLASYSQEKVLNVSLSDLEKYEMGYPIKFPQYSLLRSPRGTVYLIVGDKKRGFKSQEAFKMMGFHPEEIIDVTWEDLELYQEADPITINSVYPNGALLQDQKTGGVYYIENGIKYGLIDRCFLEINFPNRKIIPAAEGELEKYQNGGLMRLKDGELVKSKEGPTVYVISNGKKRPIVSSKVFEEMGYKWENVVTVPQKVLDIHYTGEIISTVH